MYIIIVFLFVSCGNGLNEVYLNPTQEPYNGNLVIMVDVLSGSSSEEFAGGMHAIDRATIIGQQTAGKILTMEVVPLPEGALFVFPNGRTITSKDEDLEGVGVIPDIRIELEKESLLKGIDTQLEKAIEYLTNEKNTCHYRYSIISNNANYSPRNFIQILV